MGAAFVRTSLSNADLEDKQNRTSSGKVAIMQPYLFPYVGYFHLIEASDVFVFYDDVNFIKQGWINRNRILVQGNPHTFTIPISNISSNAAIKDSQISINARWRRKFFGTITQAYKNSPNFDPVMELLHDVLNEDTGSISDLAIASILRVYDYLGIAKQFEKASVISPHSHGLGKEQRIAAITKGLGFTSYVNAINGKALYSKQSFKELGIQLSFVKSKNIVYKQFEDEFVPWLSIIDVLMFNGVGEVRDILTQYELE
ncbi:MAG: WbqC family protein [Candidatus Thiodiazotropha sp.]